MHIFFYSALLCSLCHHLTFLFLLPPNMSFFVYVICCVCLFSMSSLCPWIIFFDCRYNLGSLDYSAVSRLVFLEKQRTSTSYTGAPSQHHQFLWSLYWSFTFVSLYMCYLVILFSYCVQGTLLKI